jgi:hypothetical protein
MISAKYFLESFSLLDLEDYQDITLLSLQELSNLKSQHFNTLFFENTRSRDIAHLVHHGEQARKDGESHSSNPHLKLYVDGIG